MADSGTFNCVILALKFSTLSSDFCKFLMELMSSCPEIKMVYLLFSAIGNLL